MGETLRLLEELLEYRFNNRALLAQAITHKSYARISGKENNERLEFLGDSVLQLIISDYLYQTYPKAPEGKLAKIRALLVSQPTLANQARKFKLHQFLRVGKGEERTGARERDSLLSDAFEAVLGAMYLDGGLEQVRKFILNHMPSWNSKQLSLVDAKSTLQEHLQQTNQAVPVYNLTEERGPDHNKLFVVEVKFQDEVLGTGVGKSKKEAAQAAARQALAALDIIPEPPLG